MIRLLAAALLLAGPANAEALACLTTIEGRDIALTYDSQDAILRENRTLRERLFGGYGHVTCPAS